ncbi:histidine kinase [Fredinandcohnia quinoae]|uniref:Histidine kinase n=1 Tax=Fredinandcohnia quinoae TaxID=2918902 RepID=A0AAW5E325_9BACI|nr:histidine kinase [Fredinandcohnia sp. SECRCQ15]MCH1624492.1 histidine kinase [Fredinandcohnia sp. SECRCQ15]
MNSKRFSVVIPVSIMVGLIAMWMLNKDFAEIDLSIRLLIAMGATLLSGVITYFLFPKGEGNQ